MKKDDADALEAVIRFFGWLMMYAVMASIGRSLIRIADKMPDRVEVVAPQIKEPRDGE